MAVSFLKCFRWYFCNGNGRECSESCM